MDAITKQQIEDEVHAKAGTLTLDELKADPNLIVTFGSETGRKVIVTALDGIAIAEAKQAELRAAGDSSSDEYVRYDKRLALLRRIVAQTTEFESKIFSVSDRRLEVAVEEERATAPR